MSRSAFAVQVSAFSCPSAAGIRVVQTPYATPTCKAYGERFVQSVKEDCLNRLVLRYYYRAV